MGFFGQTQIYNQENPAVAGDRASQNPMATFDAGPGGLVAGLAGVIVGNFAWVTPLIPEGLPVALAVQGDFWVVNNGTTEAIPGVSKAYANFADGSVTFAATA